MLVPDVIFSEGLFLQAENKFWGTAKPQEVINFGGDILEKHCNSSLLVFDFLTRFHSLI